MRTAFIDQLIKEARKKLEAIEKEQNSLRESIADNNSDDGEEKKQETE